MELKKIINTYKTKLTINPVEAMEFILPEFLKEDAYILKKNFLGLFMCENDGHGYDAIDNLLYLVDPDVKCKTFKPENKQFMLFQKNGIVRDNRVKELEMEGMKPYIQQLKIIGSDETIDSHVYNPKMSLAKELTRSYRDHISYAKIALRKV